MSSIEELRGLITSAKNETVMRLLNGWPDIFKFIATLIAAEVGNLHLLKELWRVDCDMNNLDSEGRTPLMIAIAYHHYTICSFLLAIGANSLITDNNNYTALRMAIESNAPSYIINVLINRTLSGSVNEAAAFASILQANCQVYHAIQAGNLKLARYLVANGRMIDAINDSIPGVTALHLAVESKNLASVETLLECGANPAITSTDGFIPLYTLFKVKHANNNDIFKKLIERNARLLITRSSNGMLQSYCMWSNADYRAVMFACQQLSIEDALDDNQWHGCLDAWRNSILHYIAQNPDPQLPNEIKALLKLFDLNKPNIKRMTPLGIAALKANAAMIQVLLDEGADVNSIGTVPGYCINPLIMLFAVPYNNVTDAQKNCLQLLLQNGANPQVTFRIRRHRFNIFDIAHQRGFGFQELLPILAQLALLKKLGRPVYKYMIKAINARPNYRNYYDKCRKILSKRIDGCDDMLVIDLLRSDMLKLIGFAKRTRLLFVLEQVQLYRANLRHLYEYYWNSIAQIIRKMQRYASMRINATLALSALIGLHRGNAIVYKIISYLDYTDLSQLCLLWQTFFADYYDLHVRND